MLVGGDALATVVPFIGVKSTELLGKLINLVNSYPCSEEDVLDGISKGFYLNKSLGILRDFLVVLAQHCSHSLHLRVHLWSAVGFLKAFTSGLICYLMSEFLTVSLSFT